MHDPLPETLALDMEPSTLDEKIESIRCTKGFAFRLFKASCQDQAPFGLASK